MLDTTKEPEHIFLQVDLNALNVVDFLEKVPLLRIMVKSTIIINVSIVKPYNISVYIW